MANSLVRCLLVALLFVGASAQAEQKVADQKILLGPLIDFPAVGMAIEQPHGFQKALSFHGLQNYDAGASVMLTTVVAPYSKSVHRFFLPGAMSSQGMRLLSHKPVQVSGYPGTLFEVDQIAHDVSYRKWISIFGSEQFTHMVTSSFPHDVGAAMNVQMRQVALSALLSSPDSQQAQLPFVLGRVEGMQQVRSTAATGRVALYTRDGSLSADDARGPLFVASQSTQTIRIADPDEFANSRLHGSSATTIEQVVATRPVRVDGMRGIEMEAVGRDSRTDTRLSIYQLVLFPHNGGFVVMLGTVGMRSSEPYLTRFRKLARSYKVNRP